MILVGFSAQDKLKKVLFFEKPVLLADTSMEVVSRMSFLTLSNADTVCRERT